MKSLIKNLLVVSVLSVSMQLKAQDTSVQLSRSLGDTLRNMTDRFMKTIVKETKCIPFIYMKSNEKSVECYFGLIGSKYQLQSAIPSYYFYTTRGVPVFLYTGLETYFDFSDAHVNDINSLSVKYLYPDEVIFDVHYYMWYCKFIDGKLTEFTDHLSKRKQKDVPTWITNGKNSD